VLIGYARVSTTEQNLERQDGLEVERMFTDRQSGKDRTRPALRELVGFARDGDTVRVLSMDRLARSLPDLLALVGEFNGNGVTVEFLAERLTFAPGSSNPYDVLALQMLGAFAEFERRMILERQREGIARAKARGAYKGRAPALTPQQIAGARESRAAGVPLARIARRLGVARTTLYGALAGTGTYAPASLAGDPTEQ
jgi:DNA invertase Pin-like site-specific DNA recombinase